jgi:hypothetical protein
MMAVAGNEIAVPIAVAITGLSVASAVLAAAAVLPLGPVAMPRPAHQEG